MSTFASLVARHARDARLSLLAAPLVSAIVLGAIHAWFPPPAAVSEGAAIAVAVLAVLWTLYFASDAFAGDCASGQLSTLALLPVSSLTLWRARVAFVVAAIGAQVAWVVGFECALQLVFGDAASLAVFDSRLASFLDCSFTLPVLASAAILSSLLVESALAAMFAALMLLGGLALVATPLVRVLAVHGMYVELSSTQTTLAASCVALFLFAVGALAFVRGQRRLGSRAVRLMHAAWPIAAVLFVAGLATAAEVCRRVAAELDSPRLRYLAGNSTADGRLLALEVKYDLPGNDDPPATVWLLNVENGERELLARNGLLPSDRYVRSSLVWNEQQPLRVLALDSLWYRNAGEMLEVASRSGAWEVSARQVPLTAANILAADRIVPAWARIDRIRPATGRDTTIVRWVGRGLEARFSGDFADTVPGRGVLPTPVPGRVMARRGDRIVLHDMESAAEREVFQGSLTLGLWPSPSGSAVLVTTRDGTVALDAATGTPLHEAWSSKSWAVRWVDSSDDARVVQLRPCGRSDKPRILDLDDGTEFEIDRDISQLLLRLGARGYVYVRNGGDLVWVDSRGELVKVLVDR